MQTTEVPVLVVGGGVVGLSASMILSTLGVTSLLVNNYPSTSPHPKAHILNQRTMEIFSEVGAAETIYAVSTPPEHMRYAGWFTGVSGPSDLYGREIGRVEAWGCGGADPDYVAASPCRPANYPQMHLEPILKARAEALAPGRVRFNQRCVSLEQDATGVTARILDRGTGETYAVRARYVIAADGGKSVGQMVGIAMQAQGAALRMASVHFAADLSPWVTGPDVMTRFMINPDFGGSWASGVLMPEGPTQWGHKSEQWLLHTRYPFDDGSPLDEAWLRDRLDKFIGVPGLEPHVHNITEWDLGIFLAERYREGRIFLAGDSCHQHPPTGGLGMNSGVQDVYNLCWKLVEVMAGRAGDGLLDTYEVERRPVAANNVRVAMDNAMKHFEIDKALGLDAAKTPAENWRSMGRLWDEGEEADALRGRVARAIAEQRYGFRHHNVEVGATYAAGALVPDGSPRPEPIDEILVYEPSTRPGHPLPHALIARGPRPQPICELAYGGHFLVIAGEEGEDWIEAANALREAHGLKLRAIRIGLHDGDYIDTRGAWARQREISARGVIVVRPDRFVAFRSAGRVTSPLEVLEHAFSRILASDEAC